MILVFQKVNEFRNVLNFTHVVHICYLFHLLCYLICEVIFPMEKCYFECL